MIIRRAYEYRLKTDKEFEKRLRRFAGCGRKVWNQTLALQLERLESGQRVESYEDMCKALTQWKQSEELSFLTEAPSQVLQQKLKDLALAFADAFDPTSAKQMPRFKKKGRCRDSFRYPQGVKREGNRVFLPKLGWVRYFKSREVVGEIENVTISAKGGYWYVSIQTEQEINVEPHQSPSAVGADAGIANFLTLSDGTFISPLNSFKHLADKLAQQQRQLARKEKFSHNCFKAKEKISRLYHRIALARHDFLHKLSTHLSQTHAVVVLEDLQVKNMSASAKGTLDEPGRNVKAKSKLNCSILDQGWSMLKQMLSYKLEQKGGTLVLVNPAYTSQTCSACGHRAAENRLSQAVFCCISCGYSDHADINAAKNILAAGLAVMACESNSKRSRKQEPVGNSNKLPLLIHS